MPFLPLITADCAGTLFLIRRNAVSRPIGIPSATSSPRFRLAAADIPTLPSIFADMHVLLMVLVLMLLMKPLLRALSLFAKLAIFTLVFLVIAHNVHF